MIRVSAITRRYPFAITAPAEALTTLFKPFFRLDHSRTTASGGVGLGLAIAQRAIQVHNGQVWAENANKTLLCGLNNPPQAGSLPHCRVDGFHKHISRPDDGCGG